jgi:hypothetical protein
LLIVGSAKNGRRKDVFHNANTEWARWYVIPAGKKWFTRIAAAAFIAQKLIDMDPQYPVVPAHDRKDMRAMRMILVAHAEGKAAMEEEEDTQDKRNKKKEKKAKKGK